MAIKEVRLTSWSSFDILLNEPSPVHIDFLVDDRAVLVKCYSNDGTKLSFSIEEDIDVLSHDCRIRSFEEGNFPLIVDDAIDFIDFDQRYTYNGNDLGANYHKDYTVFKVWSPLASKAFIVINGFERQMERLDNGVYTLTIEDDLDGKLYLYKFLINGQYVQTLDPYALSSSSNGKMSAVINKERIQMDMHDDYLPKMNSYLDAIIYEADVRDMTVDISTNIENKGKYLGLIEKGRTTSKGNPAGFDYLTSLGFTHLQLLPILDFVTIDEDNPSNSYNWGYDPMQYFALEGSYSTNPNDPYSRIIEFKKLVKAFHKAGIRINVDVVYNHIYNVKTSLLQRIVPNYYFRRDKNNKFLDHSYCGNELASEKPMVRKLIVDSVMNLINEYHIDGLRFDLMGLLDVETMNEIERKVHQVKPDAMIYGEGWNMFSETCDGSPFANMENHKMLPNIAFFNDRYRNIVRGNGGHSSLEENGYLLGNKSYKDGFKFVYVGSCFDLVFPKLFDRLDQSLNYVECHDNATLYDVVKTSTEFEDVPRLVKKINKIIMLSFGIPFIHAGQEIGGTKFNRHNTYNAGDKYNKFDYNLLDERFELAKTLSAYIAIRKEIKIFHSNDISLIDHNISMKEENDILHIVINDINENKSVYHLLINTTEEGKKLLMEKEVDLYVPFGFKKNFIKNPSRTIQLSPMQVSLFVETQK